MTFTVKLSGSNDRPIVAEYLCPVHGRFTVEVPRDANGDPPGSTPCPASVDADYAIGNSRPIDRGFDLRCGQPSPYVISATRGARVRKVEVVRGGYRKAERQTWTDTTNLGEGQDLDDWVAERDKVWEAEREREAMELAKEIG